MKAFDPRAFNAHMERVDKSWRGRYSALGPRMLALRKNCEPEELRAILAELRAIFDGAERDLFAFFKPMQRSCHTPAERLALRSLMDRMRSRYREEIRQNIMDLDALTAQFANAEAADEEFAAMAADVLADAPTTHQF